MGIIIQIFYNFLNFYNKRALKINLNLIRFKYYITEVDPYDKNEIDRITKAKRLPIVSFRDDRSNNEWLLSNATSILSALETLRNEKNQLPDNYEKILTKYLPTLTSANPYNTINPFKYEINHSSQNTE
jgi:hypothetical protein